MDLLVVRFFCFCTFFGFVVPWILLLAKYCSASFILWTFIIPGCLFTLPFLLEEGGWWLWSVLFIFLKDIWRVSTLWWSINLSFFFSEALCHFILSYIMSLSRPPPPTALEMVIPGHAVGKVIGKGGSNIDNIRKVSNFLRPVWNLILWPSLIFFDCQVYMVVETVWPLNCEN